MIMDAVNAKYLLDYVYHTRDDEFRFYKKVSTIELSQQRGAYRTKLGQLIQK